MSLLFTVEIQLSYLTYTARDVIRSVMNIGDLSQRQEYGENNDLINIYASRCAVPIDREKVIDNYALFLAM